MFIMQRKGFRLAKTAWIIGPVLMLMFIGIISRPLLGDILGLAMLALALTLHVHYGRAEEASEEDHLKGGLLPHPPKDDLRPRLPGRSERATGVA
jgi:hypothetical protein